MIYKFDKEKFQKNIFLYLRPFFHSSGGIFLRPEPSGKRTSAVEVSIKEILTWRKSK